MKTAGAYVYVLPAFVRPAPSTPASVSVYHTIGARNADTQLSARRDRAAELPVEIDIQQFDFVMEALADYASRPAAPNVANLNADTDGDVDVSSLRSAPFWLLLLF